MKILRQKEFGNPRGLVKAAKNIISPVIKETLHPEKYKSFFGRGEMINDLGNVVTKNAKEIGFNTKSAEKIGNFGKKAATTGKRIFNLGPSAIRAGWDYINLRPNLVSGVVRSARENIIKPLAKNNETLKKVDNIASKVVNGKTLRGAFIGGTGASLTYNGIKKLSPNNSMDDNARYDDKVKRSWHNLGLYKPFKKI